MKLIPKPRNRISRKFLGRSNLLQRRLQTGLIAVIAFLTAGIALVSPAMSDPCGMVPPIFAGKGSPITRIGLQQTYVYFDKGVESFVIRPGFQGKVDNFGMLIPFPSPPALRKVPDNVFDQIAAAVDPPEVLVDLRPQVRMALMENAVADSAVAAPMQFGMQNKVSVLKQEAVGMYEVAVLEAGSAAALKRWMDQNKYQYPDGMDSVCEDYITEGWCFVAVKTKVGTKKGASPRAGQRQTRTELPEGSVFDGTVQGLGFRFKTDELVVPMRLSAFNAGDLRNVVYLLSRGGKKIRAIPEEYVVRQVSGKQLVKHLTMPLPLRIIGGTEKDIPDYRKKSLKTERDPGPKNGIAKHMFVSDIVATTVKGYSLKHEETEKELLRIGEHFGLRGTEIDSEMEKVSAEEAEKLVEECLPQLAELTLTVVDGDFPREVIAKQNLKFDDFAMAANRNKPELYDTKQHKPGGKKNGVLISSYSRQQIGNASDEIMTAGSKKISLASSIVFSLLGFAGLTGLLFKFSNQLICFKK
ncbi:MAG: DUF2330 domain-containing protein [Mariniblastus sp.]